jgi:hypothetical protein
MVMLRRRGLLAGAGLLAATPGFAASDEPSVDAEKASPTEVQFDAGAAIEQRMQEFIDKGGDASFHSRKDRGELFVEFGKATVQVSPTDQNWVKFRIIAYTEALLNAQATLVAEQNTTIITKTVLGFFKGDDVPPPYVSTVGPGQQAEIIRKILAVAGGRLDKELQDLNIDPKAYEAAAVPQQTALLTNHLKTSTMERSVADTIGCCPVKTFEGHDAAQQYCVGVVIVTSNKIRDLTRQVTSVRGEFQPDLSHAKDLSEIYSDRAALLADFGVRTQLDRHGLPVILSFGQWASSYHGADSAMASTYRESAQRQAEMIADGQISDFVKGSMTYDRTGAVGQEIDRIASTLPDSPPTVADYKKVVDEERRSIVRTSQLQITGLTTLHKWTRVHPASKTPVVGVIRMWSAATEKGVRAMIAPQGSTSRSPAAPTVKGTSGVTESRELMNPQDF